MQQGKKIRELRLKKCLTQTRLAEIAGLTQGHISDIERGRQQPSREFIKKISGVLEISNDDLSLLLGIVSGEGPKEMWPDVVSENQGLEYGVPRNVNLDRRLPKNTDRRKIIGKVLGILDSGNRKAIRALESNVEAFWEMAKTTKPELRENE